MLSKLVLSFKMLIMISEIRLNKIKNNDKYCHIYPTQEKLQEKEIMNSKKSKNK